MVYIARRGIPRIFGEACRGDYDVTTGEGLPTLPDFSIFPIVRHDDNKMRMVGTVFFITTNGLFVTAKHVLQDVLDKKGNQTAPIGIIQFLPRNMWIYRPVDRYGYHRTADIAIGVPGPLPQSAPLSTNPVLTLTTQPPSPGAKVVTFAYPKHHNFIRENGLQELYFSGAYYDGVLQEHFPEGRDRTMLPGPCYRTSIVLHGGASGGPVFGPAGHIFGVNSTGMDGTAISYVSEIDQIFSLSVEKVAIDGDQKNRVFIAELATMGFIVFEPRVTAIRTRSGWRIGLHPGQITHN
jgi:Trypsin-like peptidase domain